MEYLLVLVGFGGLALAMVNLIRPLGRLGLTNRHRAAALLGASVVAILTGAILLGLDGVGSTSPSTGLSADSDQPSPGGGHIATVDFIIDGDTLEVMLADGRSETVRLIGINTPEVGECFAEEAATVLNALAPPGSRVDMTLDVSNTDEFDRLLRYVWVGEMSVNEELVRRGAAMATRYPPDTAMAERLESAEAAARSAERGVWGPNVCPASS